MVGARAIDPSTTSITGLYATTRDDLTWNADVLEAAGLDASRLPPLKRSFDPVGTVLPAVADELGLPRDAVVPCGVDDAALAAWSGGLSEPGDANIISGTCDIANVCTDQQLASPESSVRTHVLPGRWLTFFVLDTEGVAYDWFHQTMCREMDADESYGRYLPSALEAFLDDPDIEAREKALPTYVPCLGGSRVIPSGGYLLDELEPTGSLPVEIATLGKLHDRIDGPRLPFREGHPTIDAFVQDRWADPCHSCSRQRRVDVGFSGLDHRRRQEMADGAQHDCRWSATYAGTENIFLDGEHQITPGLPRHERGRG